jgi:hypothetical protein
MSTSATSGFSALLFRLGWSPLFALVSISLLRSHLRKCQSLFNIFSNNSAHTVDDVVAMIGRHSGAAREDAGSPPISNTFIAGGTEI